MQTGNQEMLTLSQVKALQAHADYTAWQWLNLWSVHIFSHATGDTLRYEALSQVAVTEELHRLIHEYLKSKMA
jgi:hypothetical protein